MGFEETEEIGPDGKPHIISEKSFNPGGPAPKLTKAQKRQQKAMQKEMAVSTHFLKPPLLLEAPCTAAPTSYLRAAPTCDDPRCYAFAWAGRGTVSQKTQAVVTRS